MKTKTKKAPPFVAKGVPVWERYSCVGKVHRFPKTMPALEPRHFEHGTWAGDGLDSDHILDSDPRLAVCGTPRCAVGNVLSAFGLPAALGLWQGSPLEEQVKSGEGPVAEFVRAFAKNLGGSADSLMQLSDLFERPDSGRVRYTDSGNLKPHISARMAAKAYIKTIEEFGYTEEV
jgi:hypothetical protein